MLSPDSSYPSPSRAFIRYQPESITLSAPSVFRILGLAFELESSTFIIDLDRYFAPRLSNLLVPSNGNRWQQLNSCWATSKKIEIRTIRNYWEFSFVAIQSTSQAHSPSPIHITLSGWPGESKRCRIKKVGIPDGDDVTQFKFLTPIDFSSDQYKLEVDSHPPALISVRPVPKRDAIQSHFVIQIEPI